ncbi:MAG: cytochrome c biogenesis protein ResB [Planctomycetota bacterium]|jgi:hypothetical protein
MAMSSKFRRLILWSGLILVVILTGLSVFGAFLGAERAQEFFNSLPVSIYWIAFAVVLIVGVFAFRRLAKIPSLMLIHIGSILILLGSMAASEAGHRIQKQLFGIDKVRTGRMVIYEWQSENRVLSDDNIPVAELPFLLTLKDFRIEYYKPENLIITVAESGEFWKIPIKEGASFDLGGDWGSVTIVRIYNNFKLILQDGGMKPTEGPADDSNPAIEVELTSPEGEVKTRYVFERIEGHRRPDDKYHLSYEKIVKDYYSDLLVVKNDEILSEKTIEVNRPLHFGGYHFYQDSYDSVNESYTVLSVTSDSGLFIVYAGYIALIAGVFLHLWLKKLFPKKT